MDQQQIHILEEQDFQHSDTELEGYAKFLGIDIEHERDLFPIAEKGLHMALPAPWRACEVEGEEHIFYFNFETGESVWEHPNDAIVRQQVEEARAQRAMYPITLTAERDGAGLSVVGTNLSGAIVVSTTVAEPTEEHFGSLADKLSESLQGAEGRVPCFVLPDATALGFSFRASTVEAVLAGSHP